MMSLWPVAVFGGSVGPSEIVLIFLVILLLFGPRKLPEIARTVGKVLHDLRKASEEFKDQIMSIDDVQDESATESDMNPGFDEMEDFDSGGVKNALMVDEEDSPDDEDIPYEDEETIEETDVRSPSEESMESAGAPPEEEPRRDVS